MITLAEKLKRYRELFDEIEDDAADFDQMEQLAMSADALIREMARVLVTRGSLYDGRA
jgi:hypothetical protein